MGGFAALIGGLGGAAQQYGNQVRGFLEQRRTNLADTMLNLAAQEPDEQLRGEYLGHASKLLSGEPMAKMLPAIGRTVQGHLDSNNTMAQIFPPPSGQQQTYAGQAPLGQMSGTRVAEPPPSAAMYPTSQVNPWAQTAAAQAQIEPIPMAPAGQATPSPIPVAPAGQQASIEPIPPAATSQPWAFSPTPSNIPGTTLPEGSAPQARMSAIPPINPSPADLEQNTAQPQSYVDRILQHPYMRTPAGRQILAQPLANAAEMDRQLGVAYAQMGWRRQQAEPAIAENTKVLNDPNASPLERMAARASLIQTQEWIAGGGAAPNFPLTASTMLRAQEPVYHIEDATRMSLPDKQARGIPPEVEGPVIMGLPRMGGGPGQFYGQAPPHYQVGWTLDQNFNPVPMSFSPQLPNQPAQPIGGGPGGSQLQPLSQITPHLEPLSTGELAAQSAAAARLGGKPVRMGGVSVPMQPRYGETFQDIPQPDGSILRVPMRTFRGVAGVGGVGAGAPSGAGVTAPSGPGGGGAAIPGPGGRSFTKVLPQQLTGPGQKTVSTIDAVLGQIDDAMSTMEKFGLDKTHDRGYWWDDYWNYKQSGESKYGGLWTNLSFTALRSAASALAGTNSRAYPIIQRALDHTPTLEPRISLNPAHPEIPKLMGDTPAGMYNKLKEMKVLLGDAKQKAFEDEKKSGVVPNAPAQGPGATAAPPTATGGTAPLSIELSSGKTIEIH